MADSEGSNIKTGLVDSDKVGSLNVNPQKLLNWVIKETTNVSYKNLPGQKDGADDPNVTRLINLSPEEREKWMSVLFGKKEDRISDTDRLKLCISSLLNSMSEQGGTKLEDHQVEGLLQNMHFLCEVPYVAQNLIRLDGLEVIYHFAKHPNASIREHAIWILHTASGNNVIFKQRFHEVGGLEKIFEFVQSEESTVVLKKHLGVLANMLRQFNPGLDTFVQNQGVEIISKWIADRTPNLFLRSLRILNELLIVGVVTKPVLEKMNIAQIVADYLQDEDYNVRETILETVMHVCKSGFKDLMNTEQILELLAHVTSDGAFEDEDYEKEIQAQVEEILHIIKS